jgi:hypothetical protein
VEIGDAFLLTERDLEPHLWFVVSLPQENPEVVIVNLTTHSQSKDQSCILDVGDHPWIKHKSCISYRDAKLVSEEKLDFLVRQGHLSPQAAIADAVITKILIGAEITDEMPMKCQKVLIDQGLINV